MDTDLDKYIYFFASLNELGGAAMRRMLNEYGDERNIFKMSDSDVMNCPLLTKRQKDAFCKRRKEARLEADYELLMKKNIKMTIIGRDDYPVRLTNISSPPYALFYKGRLPDNEMPYVAIIGARGSSEYGSYAARLFARALAENGIGIISGLASGIDGLAQTAAIEAGGISYGILGSGVDICYPASNRRLYEELQKKGGVISEFAPGTKPEAFRFPMRNRIISALSDIVLVIEAKERSGTSITVNMALEQGKDVYAVPGRICDHLSYGCNNIIREGAGIALSPEDIINALAGTNNSAKLSSGLQINRKNNTSLCNKDILYERLYKKYSDDNNKSKIIALLSKNRMGIQEIREALLSGDPENAMPVREVMICLSELEFDGEIICTGGQYALNFQK